MNDDWKGEHLIQGRVPTKDERRRNASSTVSNYAHEQRRRAGIPTAAKAQHNKWVTGVYRGLAMLDRAVRKNPEAS